MTSLQLASDKVEPLTKQLESDVSEAVLEDASDFAQRADYEYPINRSPRVVAAAAIYLSALMNNEKITQKEIETHCDVSDAAVRDAYHELAEQEDIQLKIINRGQRNDSESKRPLFDRIAVWRS